MATGSRRFATRERELELCARFPLVAGMDEVGRGALAGPVAVGVCVVRAEMPDAPKGLADSKMLSVRRREELVPVVREWALASAVGYASADEVDAWGIIGALRLAGRRALSEIEIQGLVPDIVLLDGSHDWLTASQDLFATLDGPAYPGSAKLADIPVVTQVKADADCTVVAGASVIAKVERDQLMVQLDDPGYGWAGNKGYSSASHIAALKELGPCSYHRRSWKLPGVAD